MLLERQDVIIVASVLCIYGIGTPEDWSGMRVDAAADQRITRVRCSEDGGDPYTRNDVEPARGTFRVRGDVIEVHRRTKTTSCGSSSTTIASRGSRRWIR